MIDSMHFWKVQPVLPVICVTLLYQGFNPFDILSNDGRYRNEVELLGGYGHLDQINTFKIMKIFLRNIKINDETKEISQIKREILSSDENIIGSLHHKIHYSSPLLKIKMNVKNIIEFLKRNNFLLRFFEDYVDDPLMYQPAYMDANHPRFSPALYSAVKVWEANEDYVLHTGEEIILTNNETIKATTIKGSSMVWVYNNSEELGLNTKNKEGKSEKISGTLLNSIGQVVNTPSGKVGGNPRGKK